MDHEPNLRTSNLLLTTAIAVCAVMGVLTTLPALKPQVPTSTATAPASVVPDRQLRPLLRQSEFEPSTALPSVDASGRSGSHSRVVLPRLVSSAEALPQDTGSDSGPDMPRVYVPVTVHPVTVNMDHSQLTAEIARLSETLQQLKTQSQQTAVPAAAPTHQTSAEDSAAQERLAAIQKQLTDLTEAIDGLNQKTTRTDHTLASLSSTMTQALQSVDDHSTSKPEPATRFEEVTAATTSPAPASTPVHDLPSAPLFPPAVPAESKPAVLEPATTVEGFENPFGAAQSAVPPSASEPAVVPPVPDVPGAIASAESNSQHPSESTGKSAALAAAGSAVTGVDSLAGPSTPVPPVPGTVLSGAATSANRSMALTASAAALGSSTSPPQNRGMDLTGQATQPQSARVIASGSTTHSAAPPLTADTPAADSPNARAVFRQAWRFAPPRPGTARPASMTRVQEPRKAPNSATTGKPGSGIPSSKAVPRSGSSTARPAGKSATSPVQKSWSSLKDGTLMKNMKSAMPDWMTGKPDSNPAQASKESKTVHRATSAIRYATRPQALK